MLFLSMGCCFGDATVVEFSELDEAPTLISPQPLEMPGLRADRRANGKYWVFLEIDEKGCVVTAHTVEGPSLRFGEIIEENLLDRQFTTPSKGGQTVRAYSFLPIPIHFQ